MKIEIENDEKEIFSKILKCCDIYFPSTIPRVAGGWVRDKLMGHNSYDLDVALDNVSGFEFACKLHELFSNEISSAGLVKSNPDKSKHLETAVVNINGKFVDFVNLRKETYTTTRIPLIEFGTPEEDAFRRDLTINSLFYNLKTFEVEDFTGKGIKDLNNKIIRTPLDPKTTFSDDPLRILRIFRFHAKFGFYICDEIKETLKEKKLNQCLSEKVSKERINVELFKMIEYPKGHLGVLEIIKRGFLGTILGFKDSSIGDYEESIMFYSNIIHFLNSYNYFFTVEMEKKIENVELPSAEYLIKTILKLEKQNFNIAELSIPTVFESKRWIFNLYLLFYKLSCTKVKDKNKDSFLISNILKSSLMASNKINEIIIEIERGLIFMDLVDCSDYTFYNIFFMIYYLKEFFFEILILKLSLLKMSNKPINDLYTLTTKIFFYKRITNLPVKSPLDPSKFVKILEIEPKEISYFVAESIIFKQANNNISNDFLINYLKNNKKEIIKRHKAIKK